MDLRWRASLSASCFYATKEIVRGASLADARLHEALSQPAASLAAELAACEISPAAFFEQAVPLAADFENNRELSERILAKLPGRSQVQNAVAAGRLAGWFSELEGAFASVSPGVVNELDLRSGPLREQWEARGPGLLAAIGRKTEPGLLAEGAEVVLVHPACGGGGIAYLPYNKAALEAVLANPVRELPETVRLGWLLSMLNLDLPKYAESVPPGRLAALGRLAMLPAVLAAAADVELLAGEPPALARAMQAWRATSLDVQPLAETLNQWWTTYQETRPPWNVALAALAKMLPESP